MRIAPVGIAMAAGDLPALVARVAETCRVTHNTREAISAASAVAAAISQGIDGASFADALPAAMQAARLGAACGAAVGEADMAGRIALALTAPDEAALVAAIGTSVASREAVPAAFGVVRLAGGDPWQAALIAANIGDETDTIGAIACAMAGACAGLAAFPADKLARVLAMNRLDLKPLAARLLALCHGQEGAA
jgi:ADP-ribosylglycohydrolase